MHASRCVLAVLVVCAGVVEGGKVRDALFSLFGKKSKDGDSEHKTEHKNEFYTDEDQREMVEFLKAHGWQQYATKEMIAKWDEEIAYDSVEDLAHLVADEDYVEMGIEKELAIKMQEAARMHMLKYFLRTVPLPAGAAPDVFSKLAEPLFAAGYDEAEDIADIEDDEAESIGIEKEHLKILTKRAEEFEARELFRIILTSYEAAEGKANPFAPEEVHNPLVDALVEAGARTLTDLSNMSATTGITEEQLTLLKEDPRVARHAGKQEL